MRRWVLSGVCLAFVVLPLLIACTTSTLTGTDDPTEQPPFGKVTVHWFIGVGTGRTPGAVRAAREFVDEFNDSQGEIELELEVVTSSTHDAIDHLMARIEAGDPPDVIGPADTGWAGEQLAGRLLSLDPALYDFSDVDSRVLDSWQQGGELIGVPAGAFSSAIFYNKELFDAADMPYPPHRFGEPYADGDPWTIEKM